MDLFRDEREEGNELLVNQVLQKINTEISQIIKEDCSVWSIQGECLATTSSNYFDAKEVVQSLQEEWEYRSVQVSDTAAGFIVQNDGEPMYVFVIHNVIENVAVMGKLCVKQFETMIQLYEKSVDRNRFFQQLILDNMLLVDAYSQAKKMKIEIQAKRIVFVVEAKKPGDNLLLEMMKGLYASGNKDIVTSVDESHIILVKTLAKTDDYESVNSIAKSMVDTLGAEAMVQVRVAYGSVVDELKDVSKCYKEASMALDVGKIFYAHKEVLAYNELGIGRLIHQLPYTLCEMFLNEVFRGHALEQFDEEDLATVNAFFENDLNISETARKMYLHRNTLSYRLDKIQKNTGLDVRKFDDALTFKIALMVSDHMKFVQSQE